MWDWFIGILMSVLTSIAQLCGDWGLAIIILTAIIRLLITPLTTHSAKSQARMQLMQPKMKEIQERYAGDPVRQNEEMRKLYSEMHANPLGGCLPLILQMPIFFGLFTVAGRVPADASFYAIIHSIASSPSAIFAQQGFVAAIPYIILMILFSVLTFIPTIMNLGSMEGSQKNQQMVMAGVMSIMMLWFGWNVPAGAGLYYVTSGLWQAIQQHFVMRRIIEAEKAKTAARLEARSVEVNVVRKEKKPRQHKSGK